MVSKPWFNLVVGGMAGILLTLAYAFWITRDDKDSEYDIVYVPEIEELMKNANISDIGITKNGNMWHIVADNEKFVILSDAETLNEALVLFLNELIKHG